MVKHLIDYNAQNSNKTVLNKVNKSNLNLENNKIEIPESLLSQNLQFIPKKKIVSEKTSSKKVNYKNWEEKAIRKKSDNSEDSTSTEEINDLKNKRKIKENNNKIYIIWKKI